MGEVMGSELPRRLTRPGLSLMAEDAERQVHGRTTALDERRRSEMGPWQPRSCQAEAELRA